MTASGSLSAKLIRLPLRAEPKPEYLPCLPRTLQGIEDGLRQRIRGLVLGELPWPLLIHGPAGRGKTCAALLLLDYSSGWYRTVPDLADELIEIAAGVRKTAGAAGEGGGLTITQSTFWERIEKQPLIVLDELGAKMSVSDHHYTAVKRLLDRRERKPLIVLSNLSPTEIATVYDDRIASRVASGTVVKLGGKDRRLP